MIGERRESDDYGPGTPCSQCGETIDGSSPEWTEYCRNHSDQRTVGTFETDMTDVAAELAQEKVDLKNDLRELAERWSIRAATHPSEIARSEIKQMVGELNDVLGNTND